MKKKEDFLRKHRAEVVGMLFEEFNMKEYVKMEKQDSYKDGREEGILEGKELGRHEGIEIEMLRSIDALMKNFNIDLQKACDGVGITVEEYERAKEREASRK